MNASWANLKKKNRSRKEIRQKWRLFSKVHRKKKPTRFVNECAVGMWDLTAFLSPVTAICEEGRGVESFGDLS